MPDGEDTTTDGVRSSLVGSVQMIELNRPASRNALTKIDRLALLGALTEADLDPVVKVIVVRGAGGTFCAGGDIREFGTTTTKSAAMEYAKSYAQPVFSRMRALSTPTVAVVEGVAAGAGMYLALSCDIVIAEESAVFYPAHLDIGVVPDWGAIWLLPRLVGMARAKTLALGRKSLDAMTAAQWGLVAECVPRAQLESVTNLYVDRMRSFPEHAVALTRQGLDASLDTDLAAFLEWESEVIATTMSHPEHLRRVQKFLETKPNQPND